MGTVGESTAEDSLQENLGIDRDIVPNRRVPRGDFSAIAPVSSGLGVAYQRLPGNVLVGSLGRGVRQSLESSSQPESVDRIG